ncbi:MAG: hypothetical protein HY912_14980 [Desulfomonile tiedjei]|uniref:Uncharacterized protein n=1 Tax=Desulfomonile tiedjei TaxID=2358 RepID=A0A9D6V2R0_9BACT|nr:hypothetical protein [Desulfomonile tiedjei]
MKIRGIFAAAVIIVFACSYANANGGTVAANRTITVYNTKNKCQVVCKAPKPALAILEDGLAYLLDIPLAILSPITCPIVSPILDKIDPVEARSFPRRKK